jgi:hypothetical protein
MTSGATSSSETHVGGSSDALISLRITVAMAP